MIFKRAIMGSVAAGPLSYVIMTIQEKVSRWTLVLAAFVYQWLSMPKIFTRVNNVCFLRKRVTVLLLHRTLYLLLKTRIVVLHKNKSNWVYTPQQTDLLVIKERCHGFRSRSWLLEWCQFLRTSAAVDGPTVLCKRSANPKESIPRNLMVIG